MTRYLPLFLLLFFACNEADVSDTTTADTEEVETADDGVRMIPIETPSGTFEVYTRRVGDNPEVKLLLLHGGPGATHEYFTSADEYLPEAGIEYYYYDQLESANSDQPNDSTLWTIDRYVDEVEQVRQALGLGADNFYVLGHSWGGILAIEYALKHQEHLKGMIISNMMSSIPEYNRYADEVLGPELPPEVLSEIRSYEAAGDYGNPRYTELIFEHYYPRHVLHAPVEEWPEAVNNAFADINAGLYVTMQGPSEFGIRGDAILLDWDRSEDLSRITVPTLTVGGAHDTMDPEHMEWMADQFPNGSYLHLPDGAHMAMWDDKERYWKGVLEFLTRQGAM